MIELVGKHNKAKVFTDIIDSATIGQVTALLNQESIKDSKIRIMPDCHAGAGCVIGTTMTITDKIIPNLVGVDIGCGIALVQLKSNRVELPKLDSVIQKEVPAGFNIRNSEHKNCKHLLLEDLKCKKEINLDRAYKSLGTLGGGNHFIEVDTDDNGNKYLVVHTGSRNLGKQVAEYYQDKAYKILKNDGVDDLIKETIEKLKREGRQSEINDTIKKIKEDNKCNVPYELAYCTDELFKDYLHDMIITQKYAFWNRQTILDVIMDSMKLKAVDKFETIHNYIDTDYMILRKGAVSARKDERLLIPINMRDGSLLCTGLGNSDWNNSAPHGAGRLFSRSEAKNRFTVSEYKKTMKEAGIFTTSVNQSTLDECPMAYKSMDNILTNIKDTVVVDSIIKPVYNFKANGD